MRPFLKWPGGKRWVAPLIAELLPKGIGNYIEPFVGAGSLFFQLEPQRAVLSDINPDLIEVFEQVKKNAPNLIRHLQRLKIRKSDFLRIRSNTPLSAVSRAARFIYLNKTAFNGIYRVNRKGEFNVPFGCKPGTTICDRHILMEASRALRSATLLHGDFRQTISLARRGDLIYADPPYTNAHSNNGFVRYNEKLFSWADQKELAKLLRDCSERGIHFIASNAWHPEILSLYRRFQIFRVERSSRVAGGNKGRSKISEILVFSSELIKQTRDRDASIRLIPRSNGRTVLN